MLARMDESIPVGLIGSFTPVQQRSNRSNKARFFLVTTAVASLVVCAVLLAGSMKSRLGSVALAQSSKYNDELVVEKFDDLTHKVSSLLTPKINSFSSL
jgi:hypothetical protein